MVALGTVGLPYKTSNVEINLTSSAISAVKACCTHNFSEPITGVDQTVKMCKVWCAEPPMQSKIVERKIMPETWYQ